MDRDSCALMKIILGQGALFQFIQMTAQIDDNFMHKCLNHCFSTLHCYYKKEKQELLSDELEIGTNLLILKTLLCLFLGMIPLID